MASVRTLRELGALWLVRMVGENKEVRDSGVASVKLLENIRVPLKSENWPLLLCL